MTMFLLRSPNEGKSIAATFPHCIPSLLQVHFFSPRWTLPSIFTSLVQVPEGNYDIAKVYVLYSPDDSLGYQVNSGVPFT